MTEPQDDTPYLDALEPAARSAFGRAPDLAAISQAISLRRIADALERLAGEANRVPTAAEWSRAFGYDSNLPWDSAMRAAVDNAEGWQDWYGGECPVPEGTPVDVRFRDGEELHGAEAQMSVAGRPRDAAYAFWDHGDNSNDIVAWRLAR